MKPLLAFLGAANLLMGAGALFGDNPLLGCVNIAIAAFVFVVLVTRP